MTIMADVTINAPIEKVFKVFSDIEKIEERISGITKVEIVSDVKSGKGVRWRETRVMFKKEETVEMEMTEVDAPNMFVVESEAHGTYYKSTYKFSKMAEDKTDVLLEFYGEPRTTGAKIMSIMFSLFKGATKKSFEKDMIQLKEIIES